MATETRTCPGSRPGCVFTAGLWHLNTMHHWTRTNVMLAALAALAGACLPPSNPCDPDAPDDALREGTRLDGQVLDQDGVGVGGVVVSVVGGSETAVSGADGSFVFERLLPAANYAVRAEPLPPLAGGTTQVGELGCLEQKSGVEVRVVRPPDAPEAEFVKAVSPTSLVVAFGVPEDGGNAVDRGDAIFGDGETYRDPAVVAGDCRARAEVAPRSFRVQVRAPFDTWQDAVLSTFPWMEGDIAVESASGGGAAEAAVDDLVGNRIDDVCAAALCAQFTYLEPTLLDPRARCANVVGLIDNGVAVPLAAWGTYEVRVLADVTVDPDLRDAFSLPARVASDVPTRARQMALVPGDLLPIVGGDGAPVAGRDADVVAVVAVAGGRFALIESGRVRVVGGGADVIGGDAGEGNVVNAPHDALATDDVTETNMAGDFNDLDQATAMAALPAGDWLRVVKEGTGAAVVEKLYVGASATAGGAGPAFEQTQVSAAAETQLPMRPAATPLGALRATSYLEPGAIPLTTIGANPRDAYVLLYERGFVLVENAVAGEHVLAHFLAADDGVGSFNTSWGDPIEDGLGNQTERAFDGRCALMTPIDTQAGRVFGAADGEDDFNGSARQDLTVCFDLSAATGEDVDLRDIEPFANGTLHVIADAANDRLLVAPHGSMLGTDKPLVQDVVSLPVGREPVAMTRSRLLNCEISGGDTEVLLVANAGSGDLSVVGLVDGVLEELAVLELPTAPTGFVEDPDGPSCDDPFAWVLGADGRVFPVDVRGGASLPQCDGAACAIGSRGRARSGAIARSGGRGRAVVGGTSLVGELGFFRPAALRGAAFEQFDSASR